MCDRLESVEGRYGLIFPTVQVYAEGELGIVDDGFVHFHEAAHEHVTVLA
jgi:hypothetical protein